MIASIPYLTMDCSFLLQELELFLIREVTHVITDREECYSNKGGGFYPKTPQSVTNVSCHNVTGNAAEDTPTRGRPVSWQPKCKKIRLGILLLFYCRKLEQMQCLNEPGKHQLLSRKIHWSKHETGELPYGQLRKYAFL